MTASKRSWLARHCRSQASPPLLFGGRGVRPFPFSVPPRREWSAGRRQEVCETSFGGALRSAPPGRLARPPAPVGVGAAPPGAPRSEEHTSELQSHSDLVCRLLLEKKKKI